MTNIKMTNDKWKMENAPRCLRSKDEPLALSREFHYAIESTS